jgi:hypothetical protein
MISNGRDAKKMCGKMNPLSRRLWHRSQFMHSVHQLKSKKKKIFWGQQGEKCFYIVACTRRLRSNGFVSAPSSLLFALSSAALSISAIQRSILHTHGGPLFGLSHRRELQI